MSRVSRRFLPFLLVLVCWLLVLVVPATRRGLADAWSNRLGTVQDWSDEAVFAPTLDAKTLLKRFPHDKRVQIYAAQNDKSALNQLLERYPQDVLVLTLAVRQRISELKDDRNEGPLTNPNGPLSPPKAEPNSHSPRAEWNQFIALARRGQKLEPNNTYFDWMLLYGLYATRQDDAARAVLAKAARKTVYDDHIRDAILNRLVVMRLAYGSPLSPRDQATVWNAIGFSEYAKMRQTSRWIMEGVIADRRQGQHDRALNAAFDLVRLSRVMRRESYSIIGSLVGRACESIALGNVMVPAKTPGGARRARWNAPLAAFRSNPTMLYSYAKSHKRSDITRFLDAEWVELGKWQKAQWIPTPSESTGSSVARAVILIAAERFAALAVKVLPSILILGVIFTLLTRRFRDDSGAPSELWRGAWLGILLLAGAMGCDAIVALRSDDPAAWLAEPWWGYWGGEGLLWAAPSWVYFGLAGAMTCFAWSRAVGWQKRQAGGEVSLRTRFKTAFESPEDGLAAFDFGWILKLAARLTGWILVGGGILLVCANLEQIREEFGLEPATVSLFLMAGAFFVFLFLLQMAWRTRPRRRQTVRLSSRLAAQSLAGFFVAASVLYALVAFTTLPLARQHDRNFQSAMQRGELAMMRAKLGL